MIFKLNILFIAALLFSNYSFSAPECDNGTNGDFSSFNAVCWMPSPVYSGAKSIVYQATRSSAGQHANSSCKESTLIFAPDNNYDHNFFNTFGVNGYTAQPYCVKNATQNLTITLAGYADTFNFNAPNIPRCDASGTSSQNYLWFVENCVSNPLPVELTSFSVKLVDDSESSALVTWSTASELNSSYFSVEQSKNGADFSEAARVTAAGLSNTIKNYQVIIEHLNTGNNYFRLKQVDLNGAARYYEIKHLLINSNKSSVLYPNPVSALSVLKVNLSAPAQMVITDLNGKVQFQRDLEAGEQQINIDSSNYVPGVYFYNILADGQIQEQNAFVVNGK